jgi:hypothetical protein
MQPIQQQGLRIPSLSSDITLVTCTFLVPGIFTDMTQQIHSLRASGVRSFHFTSALGSEVNASRKSAGTLCTTPVAIFRAFFRMISSLITYFQST